MKYDDLKTLYDRPLFDLMAESHAVTLKNWPQNEIQLCTLLSIKTGNCSEDCSYCAQSAHHSAPVEKEQLMTAEAVMERALAAKANGSTRFCMGAAWKGVKQGQKKFDQVLDIVRNVSRLGMEVCVTLGELGPEEAKALKEAGVTAYNHNIDTSPEHYPNIVTTHTFDDRLNTIQHVRESAINLCCGGILGLGESVEDRLRMLEVLSSFSPAPESVPINCLQPIPGTPLEDNEPIAVFELIRMISITRIACPNSWVRLSAGRHALSEEGQAMAFFAGANSIFYGEKLLTATNPDKNHDLQLLKKLNLTPKEMPYSGESATAEFYGHACDGDGHCDHDHDQDHNHGHLEQTRPASATATAN
jgi:biotin synthase